ncbi:MAG TPA: HNH endonuclease signature motif containing protein, partial [Streptosporangiaceae bacterium]|nr:HNH endonuclease signature motif containing protein [Streptosporangiaceae bacterium]
HLGPPDPATLKFRAVIRGPCDHGQAQGGYRPGRTLRHLVAARNATCTAPGCGRPAASCDLDHTTPWHHGGPTCPCNLSPPCKR